MESQQENKDDSNVEELLKENIKLSKEIHEKVSKMHKYIMYLKIVNIIKLCVLIIPIVLALIFVPPFLEKVFELYGELFQEASPLNILHQIKDAQ